MKFKIIFIIFIIFSSFIFGLLVGVNKFPPYNLLAQTNNFFLKIVNNQTNLNQFKTCTIPKAYKIIGLPHAFIGHAYGSPYLSKENNFLSPNVVDFIEKNNSNLGSIIFTGDLFRVPSLEKWQRIRSLVGNDTKIFIAPGNHDIARSDSKDVFNSTEFGANKYPLLTNIDNTPLIIENSIESNWVVKDNAVNIINEVKDDFIIIARHNIPIVNFLSLVNSEEGRSENLESIEKFIEKFEKNKKFYWIIGDSGAFANLPRLSCFKFLNHTFLLNGLGQVKGDSLILYSKGKFFEYLL